MAFERLIQIKVFIITLLKESGIFFALNPWDLDSNNTQSSMLLKLTRTKRGIG